MTECFDFNFALVYMYRIVFVEGTAIQVNLLRKNDNTSRDRLCILKAFDAVECQLKQFNYHNIIDAIRPCAQNFRINIELFQSIVILQ